MRVPARLGVMRYLLFSLIFLLVACDPSIVDPVDPPVDPVPPSAIKAFLSISPNNLVVERGQRSEHTVSLRFDDPDESLDTAVAFLRVLRYTSADRTRYEDGINNFTDPTLSPDIFKLVLTGQQLRQGVQSSIGYLVKDGAQLGEYNINVQVFKGSEVDPFKVTGENRIAIANTIFEVR